MKSSSLLHKSFHHVPFTSLALEPCEIIQKGQRSVIFWHNKPCHFNEHEKFVILLDFSMLSVQQAVFRINVQKIWIKPRYYRVENFMRGPAFACQTLKYCEIPLTKQQNARPFHAKWVAFEKMFHWLWLTWIQQSLVGPKLRSALQIEIHVMPVATYKWLWHAVWVVPCSHQPSFSFWR